MKNQSVKVGARDSSVCKRVASITTLAILNVSLFHINVSYSPESSALEIKVFPPETNYFGIYRSVFSRNVYLDQPLSIVYLNALEIELIELVDKAKSRSFV